MRKRTLGKRVKNFTEDLADEIADDDRIDAAAKEARRRWIETREALAEAADTLGDRAQDWTGAAEDRLEAVRGAAVPAVKRFGRKVSDETPDIGTVQDRAVEVGGSVRSHLLRLGTDLADASRSEADRVIQAIQAEAERTRLETTEAERKSRVKALIGWTIFGFAAGVFLASRFGPAQAAAADHGTGQPDQRCGPGCIHADNAGATDGPTECSCAEV